MAKDEETHVSSRLPGVCDLSPCYLCACVVAKVRDLIAVMVPTGSADRAGRRGRAKRGGVGNRLIVLTKCFTLVFVAQVPFPMERRWCLRLEHWPRNLDQSRGQSSFVVCRSNDGRNGHSAVTRWAGDSDGTVTRPSPSLKLLT